MTPGVAIKPGFRELDAALVLVQGVVEAQAGVELVVQPLALNAFAIGVIRNAVDLETEIKSGVGGRHRGRRAEAQRRGEDRQHAERAENHSTAEYVPRRREPQSAISSVR